MLTIVTVSRKPWGFSEVCRKALGEQAELTVIENTANPSRLFIGPRAFRPDILLLDGRLFYSGGLDDMAAIHRQQPDTRILLVSDLHDDFEFVTAALRQGAKGVLASTIGPEECRKAVHAVYNGDLWISRKLLATFLQDLLGQEHKKSAMEELRGHTTEREREIIRHVARGMTNKEIAKQLGISDKTVKVHLSHVFRKLNVNRRLRIFQVES